MVFGHSFKGYKLIILLAFSDPFVYLSLDEYDFIHLPSLNRQCRASTAGHVAVFLVSSPGSGCTGGCAEVCAAGASDPSVFLW